MMYNYPFFSFPHFTRYPNYYYTPFSHLEQNRTNKVIGSNMAYSSKNKYEPDKGLYNEKEKFNKKAEYNEQEKSNKRSSNNRTSYGFSFLNNFLNQEDRGSDEEYFDLFGLKLYNDDLLLLSLILFLYKEDVKDQYLFFALILLLLS